MMWLALWAGLAHAEPVRHALVVGANDGGGVLEPLQYAERDAEKVADLFVELGQFDEDLVTVLYSPSENELRTALARHAALAEDYSEDLFVFYYSGHADGNGLRIGDDRYFFETLKHDLRAVDADVRLGLLDACRSGAITRLKGAAVTESLFGNEGTVEGEAWLTASAPDELAQESASLRGGFFTHYLLSGMRGAADTDDGVVDLEELHRYTFDRVVATTGATGAGTQHPHFERKLTGYGDLGLTDVRHASALVLLQVQDAGQIAVLRMPDKTQLAEFNKSSDREMAIAVPPGKYLVRRRYDGSTYEATFGLNQGSQFRVESWGNALLMYGTDKGGVEQARIIALAEESRNFERGLNLGQSAGIAGASSLMIPGAGQFYNGQFWKGLAYFGVTSSLLAGVIFNPTAEELGSGLWPMVGAAVWGASVADASFNVHRSEATRPRTGGQLSVSGSFAGSSEVDWPTHVGASFDLMLREGVSIGLDRVGFTPSGQSGWDLSAGTRLMLAVEGEKWRPAALVGFGVRHGRSPGDGTRLVTRTVFSAGGNLRYYVVPRYFVELDARFENDGGDSGLTTGVGMGVHIGR